MLPASSQKEPCDARFCTLAAGVGGSDHSEFGLIVQRLRDLLVSRPHRSSWRGLTLPLTRGADRR